MKSKGGWKSVAVTIVAVLALVFVIYEYVALVYNDMAADARNGEELKELNKKLDANLKKIYSIKAKKKSDAEKPKGAGEGDKGTGGDDQGAGVGQKSDDRRSALQGSGSEK